MLTLARDWWVVAVRGLMALLFGVAALALPGVTFEVLILVFGAYALVDGLFAFTAGLWAAGSERRWWPLVLVGIVGVSSKSWPPSASVRRSPTSGYSAWAGCRR